MSPSNVFLFYEDKNSQTHRVNFPGSQGLEKLASDCNPATFGVANEDRLDLDYRSAWMLGNTKFLTSFQPADSDIMEVVRQLLFPGAINISICEPVIVAELYKLNVGQFLRC
jgi:hypothetical protein